MTAYREMKFWSPVLGSDAARISMVDGQNQEFFMIIAADERGSVYREKRAEAAATIERAIAMGLDPGEVTVSMITPRERVKAVEEPFA